MFFTPMHPIADGAGFQFVIIYGRHHRRLWRLPDWCSPGRTPWASEQRGRWSGAPVVSGGSRVVCAAKMVSIGSFAEPSDDASSREGAQRSREIAEPHRLHGGWRHRRIRPAEKGSRRPARRAHPRLSSKIDWRVSRRLRAGADGASHDAEGPVGFHRAHAFADRLGDELFTTHRWSSRPSPLLAAGGQRRIAAAKIVGQMGNDVGRADLPGKAELSGVSGSR